MIAATMVICLLSFMVWLHHFFTMGAGADVNAVFGILSTVIAVPTGVKVFNWLFTLYGGSVRFTSALLWSLGFMVTFTIGGMTGVLLAVPPADFLLHNSLFLIAHFHNVLIGGTLFGAFAGYTYWFPKAFGFRLHEGIGKAAFWFWITGFYVAFMPLYWLGFLGMTRRMQHYDVAAWRPWLLVAAGGALLILVGVILQVIQLFTSIRDRAQLRDLTGDPWDGRSLEWSTPSPPPAFNFPVLPHVEGRDAFWAMKAAARDQPAPATRPRYDAIDIPRNSPTGVVCAFFATVVGFALIWHIWWLAIVGLLGAYATFVVFAWRDGSEDALSARDVGRIVRETRPARSRASRGKATS
jgi:cytochrome o ubiquinol oxidase subunit 1